LAVVAFCLGLYQLHAAVYGLFLAGLAGLGVWASTAAERDLGRHDDGRIVIDEVVGQLVALFPLVLLNDVSLGVSIYPASSRPRPEISTSGGCWS